jgi:hypothetical protein
VTLLQDRPNQRAAKLDGQEIHEAVSVIEQNRIITLVKSSSNW